MTELKRYIDEAMWVSFSLVKSWIFRFFFLSHEFFSDLMVIPEFYQAERGQILYAALLNIYQK